jgi:hypothetical protein
MATPDSHRHCAGKCRSCIIAASASLSVKDDQRPQSTLPFFTTLIFPF